MVQTAGLMILMMLVPVTAEEDASRPGKEDILQAMQAVAKSPQERQQERLESIWMSESSTAPRADFLYCLGAAYLGDGKAQACVGRAYEQGKGVVSDLNEAYVWYTLSMDDPLVAAETAVEDARDRVKGKLQEFYPAPSDEDLEQLVAAERNRIAQRQAELRGRK
jgi:hypothetical protein